MNITLAVYVRENGKIMAKTSMILTTIVIILLTQFIPELMPLWMDLATRWDDRLYNDKNGF